MAYLSIRDGRTVSKAYAGRKLTPKMRSFIDAYLGPAKGIGTEAVRLSDYQCRTKASVNRTYVELIDHPLIKAEIERRLAMREQKSELKAEYLIEKLISIIDSPDGEKTADRLRAIELAGKAIALWKERQEISGPNGEAIRHEQQVKESVADFTSRIASLVERGGATNVVSLPERRGAGGA